MTAPYTVDAHSQAGQVVPRLPLFEHKYPANVFKCL
jgi:hypothetical protein